MNKMFLQTERVFLREINITDISLLLDLDSDPDVMKYLSDGKPSTFDDVQMAMSRILKVCEDHKYQFGFWIAYSRDQNEFMGWFHFRPDKKDSQNVRNIELGYRLKKKFWGQGFATEVSQALLKYGFEKCDIDSVFAITMKSNSSSQNVMKKLGMTWICDYVEDNFPGNDKSAVRYAIDKDIWIKINQKI